ncbi:MAG: addiction module protein [Pseudomonadota bacterium]
MASSQKDIFRAALSLDDSERAELTALLLDSLDMPADEGVDAAWVVEIERRMKEIDSGSVRLVPWAEARERLHRDLDA